MLKRGNFLKAITSIFAIVICIGKIHGSSNINTFVKNKNSDSNSELLEIKITSEHSENSETQKYPRILQSQSSFVNSPDNSTSSKLNHGQNFIPESSKKWNSSVSSEEREMYESYLDLKNSFQASLEYLPKTFHPEKDDYQQKVSLILIGFMVLAAFVLLLDLIFLIMRFCCKKCVGPIKSSQVTRGYRNFTWILMVGSLMSLITVYIFLLTYSIKINNAVNDITEIINQKTSNLENYHIPSIKNITNILQQNSITIDQENQKTLHQGLLNYVNITKERMEFTSTWENNRSLTAIIIFGFYLLISGLAFLGFFKRKPAFLLGLSIVLLLSLPFIIIFEGFTTTYYFIYSDVCQDVHDAIYQNKFPIADVGLGYLTSCFNSKTKASLFSFAYELESAEVVEKDYEANLNLQNQLKNFKQNTLDELISCKHVYETVEFAESRFCVNGMKWSNYLISCYSWLFIIIFLCAYAVNRMKPLVEKKKNEIESMRMNEDLLD